MSTRAGAGAGTGAETGADTKARKLFSAKRGQISIRQDLTEPRRSLPLKGTQ